MTNQPISRMTYLIVAALLLATPALAQTTNDPFPTPIAATDGVIKVSFVEFASIPDIAGVAARMMLLVDEPGTRRMFVNDMQGPLYSVSYDGKTVTQYVDLSAPTWGLNVQSTGRERGFQSFAFHPEFNRPGTRGFGRFYTVTDTSNTAPTPDFTPGGGNHTHDTILLEWTAKNPAAVTYDGGPPRELLRFEQPFANHNAGQISFNPTASAGDPEFGLLYMGFADGGSGGDPLNLAQNRNSAFGKILRIDPLGANSANGKYAIPANNPFANDGNANTLGEIYAWGLRNPQRFSWDPRNGNMFVADIGQGTVEEISLVTAGTNLGWNKWEGGFAFVSRTEVSRANHRGDHDVTYPIVEYGQEDPLLQPNSSVTMGYVYRQKAIPQLANLLLFGDIPSGEVFYINADNLPRGGQDAIRRILFNDPSTSLRVAPSSSRGDNGVSKTLLQLIKERNVEQGKSPATRVDLRFGLGPDGQILVLNKGDGIVRLLVPDGARR